jgi:hypothetical protein
MRGGTGDLEGFEHGLALGEKAITIEVMNFALAILVYFLMAAILGVSILLLVAGKPVMFIISVIVFILAFGKLGCLTQH